MVEVAPGHLTTARLGRSMFYNKLAPDLADARSDPCRVVSRVCSEENRLYVAFDDCLFVVSGPTVSHRWGPEKVHQEAQHYLQGKPRKNNETVIDNRAIHHRQTHGLGDTYTDSE